MGSVNRAVIWGILGGLGLLGVYFLVMGLGSGSWSYTVSELWRLKFWVGALVIGFGTQIGLYSYLRSRIKLSGLYQGSAAASTATSTTAMIACCAHHLSDLLPIIGLSVLATTLVKYQVWFLGVGVIFNLIGIALMIKQIRKMNR